MKIVASNSLTVSNVNDGTITHTAWSYSADGTDRFTTVYPNLNLLTGASNPFIMGYGIPNTTWDTTNQVSKISLPVTAINNEVLPQGTGFPYTYTPGVTYTQSIYISTDAPLTGIPIRFTWFTGPYGHNTAGVDKLVKVSTNIYIATSTYTWPSSKTPVNGRNADLYNLTNVFDFTKGTFLQFYKPKLEHGSTATPHMPSSSEVTTADWPKYRGEYSDRSSEQSTNPSDYTWGPMRGDDGKPGPKGDKGALDEEQVEEITDKIDTKADSELTQEQINALNENNQILEAEMQAKASMEAFSDLEKTYQSFVKANEDGQAKAEADLIEAGRRIELLTTQFGSLAELKTFIDTYMSSSNDGLIIGKNDASSTIKVSSDRISMFSAGEEVMYISQGVININNGIFTASVQIGKFRTEQYHLNADMNVIRYVGE